MSPKFTSSIEVHLALLALSLTGTSGLGCTSFGAKGPREGLFALYPATGSTSDAVTQQVLSADYECLSQAEPTAIADAEALAITSGTDDTFTLHLMSDGQTVSDDGNDVLCRIDPHDEFRCWREQFESGPSFDDVFVYGWVLSPEELFGVWLDWTVESAEGWDCAAQSVWVAKWTAELPE